MATAPLVPIRCTGRVESKAPAPIERDNAELVTACPYG